MAPIPKAFDIVLSELRNQARSIDLDSCPPDTDNSFFVADLGEIVRQHRRWQRSLPRVTPFYAVKCNPDPAILRLLARLGCNFDCASQGEIELVLHETHIDPGRIVYAHPCKPLSAIRYAKEHGIKQTTFDSADELHKIKKYAPDTELLLRVVADDSDSVCKFSEKFGATESMSLLTEARSLDLKVVGVSFHVGSGASDPTTFERSLRDARTVFDKASTLGFELHTLDLGGGFTSDIFDQAADIVNPLLDRMFPSTKVIAEPGRFYVTEAYTLACNVIARREVADDTFKLFINDGIYTNFLAFYVDKLPDPQPRVLLAAGQHVHPSADGGTHDGSSDSVKEYSVWGQTADGVDRVVCSWRSQQLVEIGDWLYFEDMGAYTIPSQTRFNGFKDSCRVHYVGTEADAKELAGI